MKFWTRFPLFRLLLPFSAGIVSALVSDLSFGCLLSGTITGLFFSFRFTQRNYASGKKAQRWLAGIPFYFTAWFMGALLLRVSEAKNETGHFGSQGDISAMLVTVSEPAVKTRKGIRIFCRVNGVKKDCLWLPSRGRLVVYLLDSTRSVLPDYNEVLLIAGKPQPIRAPLNPGMFNYSRYLSDKGIYHQVTARVMNIHRFKGSSTRDFKSVAYDFREELLIILKRWIDGNEELGVAGALLLGYEEWLDPETEKSYSNAGVLHVLCVSGMHVGLIYNILAWLLLWMEKRKWLRPFRYLFLTALIWFYALVTGFSPSVIRAAAMLTLVIAGKFALRNASVYNLLCGSCLLMFVFDPFMIRSTGFILSFLAVCGIVFYHRLLLPLWQPGSKWVFNIWKLISVSLAAQLTTFPLCLYLFHQFPNYFLAGNLLIIPLSTMVMYSGLLILITDWVPFVASICGWLTTKGIELLNFLVAFIGNLPGALTTAIRISEAETLLIYVLMLCITLWLVKKHIHWLMTSMLIMIVMLGIRIHFNATISGQNLLLLYHFPNQSAISVIQGKQAVLYYTGDSLKVTASTELHRIESGAVLIKSDSLGRGKFYLFRLNNTHDLLVAKDWKTGTVPAQKGLAKIKPVLLLSGKCTITALEILKNLSPSQIILDGSATPFLIKKLSNDSSLRKIPIYITGEQGAYEIKLTTRNRR